LETQGFIKKIHQTILFVRIWGCKKQECNQNMEEISDFCSIYAWACHNDISFVLKSKDLLDASFIVHACADDFKHKMGI